MLVHAYIIIMRVLVFDTETTGLPKKYNAPIEDSDNWPHIVQLSMLLYDLDTQKIIEIHDDIIKIPKNVTITQDSTDIHGITNEISQQRGINIRKAILLMSTCLDEVQIIVAHNLDFDTNMIAVECNRLNYPNILRTKPLIKYCTMHHGMKLCNIKMTLQKTKREMIKFPKLIELHEKLFN